MSGSPSDRYVASSRDLPAINGNQQQIGPSGLYPSGQAAAATPTRAGPACVPTERRESVTQVDSNNEVDHVAGAPLPEPDTEIAITRLDGISEVIESQDVVQTFLQAHNKLDTYLQRDVPNRAERLTGDSLVYTPVENKLSHKDREPAQNLGAVFSKQTYLSPVFRPHLDGIRYGTSQPTAIDNITATFTPRGSSG